MRIAVFVHFLAHQFAFRFQTFDNRFVRIKDLHSFVIGDFFGKAAFAVHRTDYGNMIRLAGDHVVFAESRSNMNNAGTVFGRNVIGLNDLETVRRSLEIIEQRFIRPPDQFRAFDRFDFFGFGQFAFVPPRQSRSQNVLNAVFFINVVIKFLIDAQSQI